MTPLQWEDLLTRWMIAFAITQIVECPFYVKLFRIPLRDAFLASAITHPIVTFIIPQVFVSTSSIFIAPQRELSADLYFVAYGAIAESFAVIAEALWIRWRMTITTRRAFVASLGANVASSVAGGVVYLMTGWP